jgi:hypothetical protein
MGGAVGNFSSRFGNQTPAQGVAQYTPAQTRSTYNPAFSSQQTAQPVIQGLPQQMVPQAPQPQQSMQGLQGLMSQMMSRYQSPSQMQQRAPVPMTMPQYRNPALSYRPNTIGAQQNLSRVAKSVILQQKEAAEAELAAMKASQEAAAQQAQYNNYGWDSGG